MHFSRSAISSEADFARSRASARVKVPIQTANGAQIYKFATQAAPAGQRKRSEESCAGRAAAIFPPPQRLRYPRSAGASATEVAPQLEAHAEISRNRETALGHLEASSESRKGRSRQAQQGARNL